MLPKLLEPDCARNLSDKIYSQTGCFPFFYPSKYVIAGRPGTNRDSFYYIVSGLYIIYHDFGKKFICFFVDDDNCPHVVRNHVNNLGYLRTLIVHGSHNSGDKNKTVNKSFIQYLGVGDKNLRWEDGFLDRLTDKEWEWACKKLTEDSNKLYAYLMEWGVQHKETSVNSEFQNEKYFANSFDKALIKNEVRHMINIGRAVETETAPVASMVEDLYDNRGEWVPKLFDREKSQEALFERLIGVLEDTLYPDKANPISTILAEM